MKFILTRASTIKSVVLISFVFSLAINVFRATDFFTAVWDEHTHLSYVQYVFSGIIPAEGFPLNSWAKSAFSCHPHALYGVMTSVPCGQIGPAYLYPTGGTSTSQGWPPIYFFLVSVLMRPFLLVADPLFAARVATAIIWALGTAVIVFAVFKLRGNAIAAFTIGLLLNSIPYFAYFSAFVSPHSMIPLLIGTGILIVLGFVRSENPKTSKQNFLFAHISHTWMYLGLFLLFSTFVAFTIPQALSLVLVMAFVMIALGPPPNLKSEVRYSLRSQIVHRLPAAIASILAFVAFFGIYKFWAWQVLARSQQFPWEIDKSLANIDTPNPSYPNIFIQIFTRWFAFWPNAYSEGYPVAPAISFVEQTWCFILPAAALAVLLFWKKFSTFSVLILGIFIISPIISIAFDVIFLAGVPARYGLTFSILGLFALANKNISKQVQFILLVFAVLTFFTAWQFNPLYVESTSCFFSETDSRVLCP